MRDIKTVKQNFIFNMIFTVCNMLFQMVTFPYVTRVIGPEGVGNVSFATSVVYYFNIFAQLGIPTYGVRAIAKVRDNKEELTRLIKELLLINLLLSIGTYFVLAISLFIIPKLAQEKLLICIISISIFLNIIGVEWLYKGLEEYEYITKRSIFFKLIALVAVFALVSSREDYIVYGTITIFASSASNILNFFYAKKYIGKYKKQKLYIKKHMKSIGIFFAMSVATTIYVNLDTVMLGVMTDNVQVGYYDAAIKIRRILLAVVTSLGTVILPRASYFVSKNMINEFYSISRRALEFVVIISAGVVCYFSIFAYDTVFFLSGSEFSNSVLPMKIIMPTVYFAGITNVLGIQMLIPLGKEKIVLYSEVLGGVVDLALNIILIPKFASVGAAIGTTFAEVAVFLVQSIYMYRFYHFYLLESYIIKIAASLIIPFATCMYIFNFFDVVIVWRIIVSSLIFFTLYAFSLWITKEPLFHEIVCQLYNRLSGSNRK